MRRARVWSVAVLAFGLAALAPDGRATAQTVLVFDENSTHGRALDACMRLGLMCSRARAADFATSIGASRWDLVVVDLPSTEPSGAWQTALINYISAGGRAIHTQWNMGSLAGLPAAYQVSATSSHDGIPFHRWSATTPLFTTPNAIPTSFTVITDVWGTNGFYLEPVGAAYSVAGFTMSPASNQAAIVIGNSDRTIFNGFLFDDFTGDVDGDMIPDVTELVMNEISFLLGASAPTMPCMGVPEGGMCTTAAGAAGRCRSGGCCTGCWDGMRCQIGSGAAACGAAGATCASCVDGLACTSDVCMAGACSNPSAPMGTACSDGLFCTSTDRCDGAGACVGSGAACNDGASCTVDTCDEMTDTCVFTPTEGCTIGGVCVGDGVIHPVYGCLACDRARNPNDWSPRPMGTVCGMDRCTAGRLTPASVCDSMGTCAGRAPMPCPSGMCADAMSCAPTCADTGCAAGEWCAPDGTCMPQLATGTACGGDAECASGECVDGVCCDTACDGVCERCDAAMSVGTCSAVAAGSDPDMECDLACDGAGACMMGDAGMSAIDGGARADASTSDAGSPGTDAGPRRARTPSGCGCGISATAPAPWLATVLLALIVARRRRARRS